ncbi:MAG: hypothetical protein NC432_10940 [Roseburia sp.]|nr:hypothetical protein [Roseburia sp.]MCM1099228.1 hypothetical protein [Ruminococcus flavefaciens]
MKEEEKVLVLCDTEEEYAQLMTEFMKKHKELPWKVRTYTQVDELLKEEEDSFELLAVSESAYTASRALQELQTRRTVILNESGRVRWENIPCVDKYQPAEEILKYLLQVYMEIADTPLPRLKKSYNTVFIGNYSPVHRSMQTSFALTMSQILAREHTTLYLNFEHYVGIAELMPDLQTLDLADLMYFLSAEKEKFRLRMQTMLRHVGRLDYISPMKAGQNLLTIPAADWVGLLQKIEELGEYEYVVLDLSESMQGLFDILRMCRKVFTLTREDRIAKSKLLQYEQLLGLYEYGDVLEKTKRLSLAHIQRLPEELEQLTRGDLAALVHKLLKDLDQEAGEGGE